MKPVRQFMSRDVTCVGVEESVVDAARAMRAAGVGALPICGPDGALRGMVTDRDIVVDCVAEGVDPAQVPVAVFAEDGMAVLDVRDSLDRAIDLMDAHGLRRLPVVDGGRLVGMVTHSDLARHCGDARAAALVSLLASPPEAKAPRVGEGTSRGDQPDA